MKRNSLTILFLLFCLVCVAAAADNLYVFQPFDRTIVYQDNVTVEGKARGPGLASVVVEGVQTWLDRDGRFAVNVSLVPGKNYLLIQSVDTNGRTLAYKKLPLLRLLTYGDLNNDQWSKLAIEQLATLGVVNGYPDGNFYPNNWITRAELISMLVNLRQDTKETATSGSFSDLTPQHWAYDRIDKAVALGLAEGYEDGSFRPDNTLTRLEAIAIISRFAGLKNAEEVQFEYFDLPQDNWGVKIVAAAKQAGLLGHIKSHYLEPKENISRGEALGILSKTGQAQKLIQDLMSFNR